MREGRGKRLKETPEIFSGLIWTGQKSVDLGLADGFGSLEYVAREVVKAEDIVDFTQKEGIAEKFARRFGAARGERLRRSALLQRRQSASSRNTAGRLPIAACARRHSAIALRRESLSPGSVRSAATHSLVVPARRSRAARRAARRCGRASR